MPHAAIIGFMENPEMHHLPRLSREFYQAFAADIESRFYCINQLPKPLRKWWRSDETPLRD